MIMAVGLTVSKIGRGQRSERSGNDGIDDNLLKYNLGPYISVILNLYLYTKWPALAEVCCTEYF